MCCFSSPLLRAVFSACGHMVCGACATQLQLDKMRENRSALLCPYCRREGKFVMLVEERIAEKRIIKEEGCCNVFPFTAIGRFILWIRENLGNKVNRDALARAQSEFERDHDAFKNAMQEGPDYGLSGKSLAASAAAIAARNAAAAALEAARAEDATANLDALERAHALAVLHAREAVAHLGSVTEAAKTAQMKIQAAQIAALRSLDHLDLARKKNNDEKRSPLVTRFSRCCRACTTKSPRHRSFFPSCRHAVCLGCAERQVSRAAETNNIWAGCPFCDAPGGFVPLYEDLIQSDAEEP